MLHTKYVVSINKSLILVSLTSTTADNMASKKSMMVNIFSNEIKSPLHSMKIHVYSMSKHLTVKMCLS